MDGTAGKYAKGGRGEGVYVLGRDAVVGSRVLGGTVCWVLRTLMLELLPSGGHHVRCCCWWCAAPSDCGRRKGARGRALNEAGFAGSVVGRGRIHVLDAGGARAAAVAYTSTGNRPRFRVEERPWPMVHLGMVHSRIMH